MKHLEINNKNLKFFYKTLRQEDKCELDLIFFKNKEKNFIKLIKKQDDIDFIANDKLQPLALGGVKRIDKDKGQIWLLCSNFSKNHKLELVKYLDSKINIYKKQYNILFNYIYKSNFHILSYLEKRGFNIADTNNVNFKIFYYINGGKKFDI